MVMMILQEIFRCPLVDINNFNALVDNKPLFDQLVKTRQGTHENLVEM